MSQKVRFVTRSGTQLKNFRKDGIKFKKYSFTDNYTDDMLYQLIRRVDRIAEHEKIFIEEGGEYHGRIAIEDYRLG